jgi:hypothetical protein
MFVARIEPQTTTRTRSKTKNLATDANEMRVRTSSRPRRLRQKVAKTFAALTIDSVLIHGALASQPILCKALGQRKKYPNCFGKATFFRALLFDECARDSFTAITSLADFLAIQSLTLLA